MIATERALSPGFQGTSETVAEMQARIRDALLDTPPPGPGLFGANPGYKRRFVVRRAAEWIVKNTPGGARREEARALAAFTKTFVRYTRDPRRLEWLTDPRVLLERIDRFKWAAEDCDGHTMLTAALGCAIQLPMRIVLVSNRDDGGFNHVYAAMQTGPSSKEWLAGDDGAPSGLLCMDTASPDSDFDRHPWANKRALYDALPKE